MIELQEIDDPAIDSSADFVVAIFLLGRFLDNYSGVPIRVTHELEEYCTCAETFYCGRVGPGSCSEDRSEARNKLSTTHHAADSGCASGIQFGGVHVRAECD